MMWKEISSSFSYGFCTFISLVIFSSAWMARYDFLSQPNGHCKDIYIYMELMTYYTTKNVSQFDVIAIEPK